ncbi:glycosyltransferase family 2 protein [Lactovum odontotermitis]
MGYENWLTKLLSSVNESSFLNDDVTEFERMKNGAKLLDLGEKRFRPSFFEVAKKDYLSNLSTQFKENYSSTLISIGIMVKNQEDKIENTLASALNFCDNLIVVDTGSTDDTVEKIKAYQSSKLGFYEIPWTGNFSEMRNHIIDLNKNKWLFFVDSDEVINPGESFEELRCALTLIDILIPDFPVCLQIKQWATQYRSFSFIERIIRRKDRTRYYGTVHEGVEADGEVEFIHLEFSLTNKGLLDEEMSKFDKKEIYKTLTLELLEKEPNNPRWIANLTNPDVTAPVEELNQYFDLLKRGILVDVNKKFTLSNLREGEFLHMILGKYLLIRIARNELDLAIAESHVALKKFPMSTFILFIHHYAKYLKNEKEKKLLFEDLLADLSAIDNKEAEEVSQQKQDLIESLVVKYMFDFHNYKSASLLLNDISDKAAKENLLIESSVLRKIQS